MEFLLACDRRSASPTPVDLNSFNWHFRHFQLDLANSHLTLHSSNSVSNCLSIRPGHKDHIEDPASLVLLELVRLGSSP